MSTRTEDLEKEIAARKIKGKHGKRCDLYTPNAWLYSTEYEIAGAVFELKEGVVCPIDTFQLSSNIEQTIEGLLTEVRSKHSIDWVTVPAVLPLSAAGGEELRANLLYQDIPVPPFSRSVMREMPNFVQCRAIRAKGLKDGTLSEQHLPGRQKLIERLKLVTEGNPPNAALWAYLYGLYDLLRLRRTYRAIAPLPSNFRPSY